MRRRRPGPSDLQHREVRYVIAYEPDRLVSTSAVLLDEPPSTNVLATPLFQRSATLPGFTLVYSNPYFRIRTPPIAP